MTKPETYKKVAQRYLEKMDEISKRRETRFSDVAGNLLMALSGYTQFIEQDGVASGDRANFLRSLKKVRQYFRLIEKYSEFRQGELTNEGAFPDLYEKAIGLKKGVYAGYIESSKQRLEGRVKNE